MRLSAHYDYAFERIKTESVESSRAEVELYLFLIAVTRCRAYDAADGVSLPLTSYWFVS